MPQVIPVVIAAFQSAVTWVSVTAASATLAFTGSAVASAFVGNAILAAGGMLSASVAAGAPLAAATGALLKTAVIAGLMKALSPKPKNLNGGAQIRFGPNPQAPRPFLFGRTGTAGTPVVATTHGTGKSNNKWLTYIVALSAFGPVNSIEALALNGVNAPTSGGMVVSGQYANKVWNTYRTGEWTQAWTPTFGPSTIPEWTSNHRGAGIAHACLTYEYDPNVFTGGAPAPVWTVQGSTGIYNASTLSIGYSGNPADVYYTILRGIQSPNGTKLGVGLAAADIDQAKIAAWRAVCVANNWTVGGVWQVTAETPADVLRAVLQAGGAEFAINDGKASVDFFASAASAYTIRESDLAGDPIERPSTDRKARVSRVIPRFRSEADGWDLVPAAPVVDTTLDTQDGNRRRTETMDFPYVSSAQQARQLAAYNLRARRSPVFELPIKPHGAGIPSGARVTLDLGDYGISSSTCVVIKNDATATDGGTLTVRADPSDLHTWALGQDGSTVSAGSMPRDPASTVQNVDTADWTAAAATISASGAELPIIRVTGVFPNPTLVRLDVQIKPNASTDWIDTSSLVSGTPALEIRGLTPSTIYNIRARYVTTGGVASPSWTNFANVTTGVMTTASAATVPWTGVTGTGRPEDNATVGGRVGVNIFPGSGSTPLPGTQLLNDQIGIDANGRLTNTGTGTAVVGNAQITIDANGRLTTTGTGSVVVDNSKITLGTLGFTGATDATRNVVSTGLLAARPTGSDGDIFFATDDNNGAGLVYTKIAGAWVADPKAKVLFDNLTTTVNNNEATNSSFRSSQTTTNSATSTSLSTLSAKFTADQQADYLFNGQFLRNANFWDASAGLSVGLQTPEGVTGRRGVFVTAAAGSGVQYYSTTFNYPTWKTVDVGWAGIATLWNGANQTGATMRVFLQGKVGAGAYVTIANTASFSDLLALTTAKTLRGQAAAGYDTLRLLFELNPAPSGGGNTSWILLTQRVTEYTGAFPSLDAGPRALVDTEARIITEETVRASADSALALRSTTLEARFSAPFVNLVRNSSGEYGVFAAGSNPAEGNWWQTDTAITLGIASAADTAGGVHRFLADFTTPQNENFYSVAFEHYNNSMVFGGSFYNNRTAGTFQFQIFGYTAGGSPYGAISTRDKDGNDATTAYVIPPTAAWTQVERRVIPSDIPAGCTHFRIVLQWVGYTGYAGFTRLQGHYGAVLPPFSANTGDAYSVNARIVAEESARASADSALASRSTVLEARVAPQNSNNWLPNSNFSGFGAAAGHAFTGWIPFGSTGTVTSNWYQNQSYGEIYNATAQRGAYYDVAIPDEFAGSTDYWSLSALTQLYGGAIRLFGQWFDVTRTTDLGYTDIMTRTGGSGWEYRFVEGLIRPAGARWFRVHFDNAHTSYSSSNVCQITNIMFTRTKYAMPWTASGEVPSIYAAVKTEESARASADAALATRNTTLEAIVRFPTPEAINKNPTFSTWSGASGTLPEDWGEWSNGTSNTKAVGSISPNAYRQSHTAGATSYGVQQSLDGKMTQGWYVIEADVTLNSGVLTGSGMYFHYGPTGSITNSHTFNFATEADIDGAVNGVGVVGRRYRYAKLVQLVNTAGSAQIFLMTNWDNYGTSSNAKDLTWHKCLILPASDSEIELRAARSGSASVGARITTEESARASGDSANASLITTLTAGTPNLFPVPTPINALTPTQQGWVGPALSNIHTQWGGGFAYYKARPSGGSAVTEYYYYDLEEDFILGSADNWTISALGYGGAGIGSDCLAMYIEILNPTRTTTLAASPVVIVNSTSERVKVSTNYSSTFLNPVKIRVVFARVWPASGSYQDFVFNMVKLERGTVATAYTNSAQVIVQANAITNLNNSAAFYQILVAASGGDPALIRLFSGLGGSEVAIAAKILSLVNTTDGSAMEVMRAIGGLAFFRRPISADSNGRRVTIGPGFGVSGSQVVLWFGPDTIAPDSQSRTNGYFALGTDGIIYYGSAVLGSPVSATRKVDSNSNGTDTNNSWQTIASVILSNCPGGNLYFDGSFYNVASGTGTCDHKARITIDGTLAGSELATQNTVTGGTPSAVIMDDLFAQILTVTAGSRTIAFQLQRTSGSGNVDVSSTRFDVSAFPI